VGANPLSAVLDARDVSRSFGDKQVLSGVDLQVGAGRISALLGPNGAGKTTFLRILTGLLLAEGGHVSVAGIDVGRDPMAARRHIGFFPSADRTFYNRISGLENLAFFGRMYGIRRQEALARAGKRLVDVGLSDAVDQRVGLYSHGMQKRLSMARALLMDPPVLVIDEATDGLDPEGARRVQDLTRSIAADGTAVVWTTQRLDEIRGFAASNGVVEGPARVVKSVEEISRLQPGDILVCQVTNPTWAPIFQKIAGAVSDIGGSMSHAAIVAREYGLPAVVGTGSATTRIKDGQRIRVDGGRGVVTIL